MSYNSSGQQNYPPINETNPRSDIRGEYTPAPHGTQTGTLTGLAPRKLCQFIMLGPVQMLIGIRRPELGVTKQLVIVSGMPLVHTLVTSPAPKDIHKTPTIILRMLVVVQANRATTQPPIRVDRKLRPTITQHGSPNIQQVMSSVLELTLAPECLRVYLLALVLGHPLSKLELAHIR